MCTSGLKGGGGGLKSPPPPAPPVAPQALRQPGAAGTVGRGGATERTRRGVPQSTLLAGGLGPVDPLVGQVTLLGS